MQRAINKSEKRVNRLEKEIEALETRMADPEFYQSEKPRRSPNNTRKSSRRWRRLWKSGKWLSWS